MAAADKKAVTETLLAYGEALNNSSAKDAVALYAPDGVFMAQNAPTSIGTPALTNAYNFVFNTITLSVKFTVHEVVPFNNEWAFARTSSAGTQKINATGETTNEANQELFVMQKNGAEWKIARYCFSTTNPPK